MFHDKYDSETRRIKGIIEDGAQRLSDMALLEYEIQRWKRSPKRAEMFVGEDYYAGRQKILRKARTVIGENGVLTEVNNLPNNIIIDNQYAKMVDQKANYLLGKPLTIFCENEEYSKKLNKIFDRDFSRIMKNICEDCLNSGIGWLYLYYDKDGKLCFKSFKPYEILPLWNDSEHTDFECAVRLYEVPIYEEYIKSVEIAEIYTVNGVQYCCLKDGRLEKTNIIAPYIHIGESKYNWNKIPIIPFKYNNREISLIKRIKPLQDALNMLRSQYIDNMQEDSRNTILVIKNYDGTDLGEFRRNLAQYGAVKVTSIDGSEGGIDTLKLEIDSSSFNAVCNMLKDAIIENARGYDARDSRLMNNPNQMNIQSMYSDIDLDANGIETEFHYSLQRLLWFINTHIYNTEGIDYSGERVEFIFNRDMLINESESISNCAASKGIISDESIIAQHPWVMDTKKELKRLEEEGSHEFTGVLK